LETKRFNLVRQSFINLSQNSGVETIDFVHSHERLEKSIDIFLLCKREVRELKNTHELKSIDFGWSKRKSKHSKGGDLESLNRLSDFLLFFKLFLSVKHEWKVVAGLSHDCKVFFSCNDALCGRRLRKLEFEGDVAFHTMNCFGVVVSGLNNLIIQNRS
jgi:hypothetical protein